MSHPASPLRKSHIEMGKSNDNRYITQFKSIYGSSPDQKHYGAYFQSTEDIQKLSKDLRATHI
jgi:hypothetical protein